ncbi:hypothetical protein [Micrococcoides hystricis]|uniref:Uncharacterized protein n=1 Tax=Micrococcoides hystricis TaxID=1572761 RepID=A0ABV6P808_9MICC
MRTEPLAGRVLSDAELATFVGGECKVIITIDKNGKDKVELVGDCKDVKVD